MAQIYWEADPADVGLPPSNLTYDTPWATVDWGSSYVEDVGSPWDWVNRHALRLEALGGSTNSDRFIRLLTLGGVAIPESNEFEVFMEAWYWGGFTTFYLMVMGSTPERDGYMTRMWRDDREIVQVLGGRTNFTALASEAGSERTWDVRFRVKQGEQKLKIWQHGTSEPSTWNLETTDTAISAPGGVGFYVPWGNNGRTHIASLGIGTDGDPAPTEPVPTGPGVPTNTYTDNITENRARFNWSAPT